MNNDSLKIFFLLIILLHYVRNQSEKNQFKKLGQHYFCNFTQSNFLYGIFYMESAIDVSKFIFPKVILTKLEEIDLGIRKPDFYLLTLKISRLEVVFKSLHLQFSWNPRATFLITSKVEEYNEILKVANMYFVTNLKFCNDGNLVENGREYGRKNFTLKILAAFITPYVFFDKNKIDGIEVRCLKTIQKIMKFDVKFLQHNYKSWGLQLPNGTYTDMFQKLQNYEVDIVMGMWPTNFTHILNFDVSFPYLEDALVWMVPKAQIIPDWKRLVLFNKLA